MYFNFLRRYRIHHHNWSTADFIAFICAIVVIYAIKSFAQKYFPNISESKLKIISIIVIIVAVLIANSIE